ncbi:MULTISPECIES: hypothetical protein [unclassified Nonomuraea]|uniref:hypothetical protein n=1 Tax=unclassified Nonomuraea TaxID=2593643 RepID=UPI0035BF1000
MSGPPPVPRPPGDGEPVEPTAARRLLLAAGAVLLVLVVLLIGATAFYLYNHAMAPERPG